jgi:hypothetical protein
MSPLTANIFLLAYSVYFANISYASQNFASVRSMLCKVQYELVAHANPDARIALLVLLWHSHNYRREVDWATINYASSTQTINSLTIGSAKEIGARNRTR